MNSHEAMNVCSAFTTASEEERTAFEKFWNSVVQGRKMVIDGKPSTIVCTRRPVIVHVPVDGNNNPIWQQLTHFNAYDYLHRLPEVSDSSLTSEDDLMRIQLFLMSHKNVALVYHRRLQRPCFVLYDRIGEPCLCFDCTTKRPLGPYLANHTPLFPSCISCNNNDAMVSGETMQCTTCKTPPATHNIVMNWPVIAREGGEGKVVYCEFFKPRAELMSEDVFATFVSDGHVLYINPHYRVEAKFTAREAFFKALCFEGLGFPAGFSSFPIPEALTDPDQYAGK